MAYNKKGWAAKKLSSKDTKAKMDQSLENARSNMMAIDKLWYEFNMSLLQSKRNESNSNVDGLSENIQRQDISLRGINLKDKM